MCVGQPGLQGLLFGWELLIAPGKVVVRFNAQQLQLALHLHGIDKDEGKVTRDREHATLNLKAVEVAVPWEA